MWGRLASISVFSWLIFQAAPAISQAPLQAIPVSNVKPSLPPPVNLLQQQKLIRLEVIAGKILPTQLRTGQSRTLTAGDPEGTSRQLLVIAATGAHAVALKYEATDAQTRTLLTYDEHQTFLLESERLPNAANASTGEIQSLRQQPSGEIQFVIKAGQSVLQQAKAADLWQFALIHPKLFYGEVAPLLESCRPDWGLAALAVEVRSSLLEASHLAVIEERQQWTQWVDELSSDDFKTRQAADRALRDLGLPVLRFLQRTTTRHLETEQRTRIARMLQTLAEPKPDTPLLISQWLVDDPALWLAWLQSQLPPEQAAAKEHLSQQLGQPIVYHPQAAAAEQAQQLARLKKQLAGEMGIKP